MLTPRWYQQDAINAVIEYFTNGSKGNPLLKLPTGSGKSLVQAEFIRQICTAFPTQRILCLAHVKELIGQNHEELLGQWPAADAGIYSAGLGKKQLRNQITFAGIQSVCKKAAQVGHVDLIFIDECHLVNNQAIGNYRRFIDDLKKINPYLKVIGLTATPWRTDNGSLTDGDGSIFNRVVYEVPLTTLIEEGSLCNVRTVETHTDADFTKLKVGSSGDFTAKSIHDAIESMDNTKHAIDEACKLGEGRNSWLVFACSIEHAENAAQCLKDNGISCAVLTGKTPKKERAQLIEDFKNFKYKALVSVSCLTTGFNAKNADYMICLRPTQSSSLWVQMVGRVMRTHQTKVDGLLADYGGNVERHGPIEDIQPPKKQQGTARKKTCPECGNKCSASAKNCKECNYAFSRVCPNCDKSTPMSEATCTNCGHEFFSERLVAIAETAAKGLDVVSAKNTMPDWIEVTGVTARRHMGRNGKPDSLRIDYSCGLTSYPEWLGIESSGGFRGKAERHYRDAGLDAPITITEALSGEIPRPSKIMVRKNGKYFDVIGKIF